METTFIKDKPSGNEFFEGNSQKNLALAIVHHITKTDELEDNSSKKNVSKAFSRIIGLEGEWGSGKSNVIEQFNIVDKDFNDKYKIFTYDAWAHQEDLLRRSILETMTNTLITEEFLKGKGSIKLRNGEKKEDSWDNLLIYLLSNKTTTISNVIPKVKPVVLWILLVIILMQITTFVATEFLNNSWLYPINGFIIYAIPIVLTIFITTRFRIKDKNWDFLYDWTIKDKSDCITEQFTSSEEPSVQEFKNWMSAISKYIDNVIDKQRLIIVFDNMDRLPAEKVKQLWSSIYAFFAGEDYDNIWVIIPYDEKHLCNVYKDERSSDDITDKFIRKTFPIVFRVAPPIISDYEQLFKSYYNLAFCDNHDESKINQIYRILTPIPNPRDVIYFLNQLVLVYQQWGDRFKLANMALYVIRKTTKHLCLINQRTETKDKNIITLDQYLLGKELFDKVQALFPNKEESRNEITALVYGLNDIKKASEIAIKNYISECLISETGRDINLYSDRKHFISILVDAINAQPHSNVNIIVTNLEKLKVSQFSKDEHDLLLEKWDYLANYKMEIPLNNQIFDEPLKILLLKCKDKYKQFLIDNFCKKLQNYTDFSGKDYFMALSNLELFINDNNINCKLSYLADINVDPPKFIDYIVAAKDKYKRYKLHTYRDKLEKYLCSNMIDANLHPEAVQIIKDDNEYTFDKISTVCEKLITEKKISENNIMNVMYLYRILSSPNIILSPIPDLSIISNCYPKHDNSSNEQAGYEDLITLYLYNIDNNIQIQDNITSRLASCVTSYIDLTTTFKAASTNTPSIKKINTYIIENNIKGVLDLSEIIKYLPQIHDFYEVEWMILFNYLEQYLDSLNNKEEIIKNSLEVYFPINMFEIYKNNICVLSDKLYQIALTCYSTKQEHFIIDTNGNVITGYWSTFIKIFLGSNYFPTLDDKLKIELQFAYDALILRKDESIMTNEIIKLMITNVDSELMIPYMNEKRNNYTNGVFKASAAEFKYFENWFRLINEPISNPGSYIQNFVENAFLTNNDCRNIVSIFLSFYVPLISQGRPITDTLIKFIDESNDNICLSLSDEIHKEESAN